MFKKIFGALAALLLLLIGILLFNALSQTSRQIAVESVEGYSVPVSAVEHLQEALRIPTISYDDPALRDTVAFLALHQYIADTYPLIDSILEKKRINYSLLCTWKGSDPSLKPIILMAHMDVVPVDSSTIDEWEKEPFSGARVGDEIVGRGAMDDKASVIGILEAVEAHLHAGYQPSRTIYLAFGHDEEVGGFDGAGKIAAYLKDKGVEAELVLDEGGFIAEGMVPGVENPVAIVNTAEKGFVSYQLTINTPGGHSSAPPEDNTIGSLATAITRLEANQLPYKMLPIIEEQLSYLGPEMPFMQRLVFANAWLFKGVVLPALNVHTSTAPTIIHGGIKDNVIPTQANATINFRILPGETLETVKEHIINTIDDERITVSLATHGSNPSSLSSSDAPTFQQLAKTIRQLSPETIVSPGLLVAGTDTKHYESISNNIYRFLPIRINSETLTRVHGTDERISIETFEETVRFYHQLIINMDE